MAQHCCIASWTSCCSYYHRLYNLPRNKFQCCKFQQYVKLQKVDQTSTFCNNVFQLATLKFIAWQVQRAVVIRATTCSTCKVTMLRDKLKLKKMLPILLGLYTMKSTSAGVSVEYNPVHSGMLAIVVPYVEVIQCWNNNTKTLKNCLVYTSVPAVAEV